MVASLNIKSLPGERIDRIYLFNLFVDEMIRNINSAQNNNTIPYSKVINQSVDIFQTNHYLK